MEYGSIEREVRIEAPPEVVFEVVTSPEHIKDWWEPSEARLDPRPGGTGELVWGDRSSPDAQIATMTVVDSVPPRLFSFRWVYDDGVVPGPANSLFVTFEITADGAGSVLRMVETGFRERGWDAAVLEAHYQDHVTGWDHFLPRLVDYAARLVSS